jgi:hypothetical protein
MMFYLEHYSQVISLIMKEELEKAWKEKYENK